ncbi:MAG: hypothetical protein K0R66_1231 [Gammaproteobacteria bacterium]|nr:hypothetical protein [Gammaproteobacteria bacterium]
MVKKLIPYIALSAALLLSIPAFADYGTALAAGIANNSSSPSSSSTATSGGFPAQQNQFYQNFQLQFQQLQQAYVNVNSLNPASYNLPAVTTPAANATPSLLTN